MRSEKQTVPPPQGYGKYRRYRAASDHGDTYHSAVFGRLASVV